MGEKKVYPRRLRIFSTPDLSRKWYISYYEKKKRVRVYGEINQQQTYEGRMAAAEELLEYIRETYQPQRTPEEQAWDYIEKRRPHWRHKTYLTYKSKLVVFLEWAAGRKITKLLVEGFFEWLIKGHKGGTYNDYRQILRSIFRQTDLPELFEDIPKVNSYATPDKRFQRHQRTRLRRILAQKDDELLFFCECIFYLLVRPKSELRFLRVADFDLDRWRVFLSAEVSKNRKPEYVTIPQAFRDRVVEYLGAKNPSEWLFPSPARAGKKVGYNTLRKRYRKILTEAGFGPEYTFYSWKHTGAVACIDAGINPKKLQIQLRHSSLEITDRYLSQLGVQDLQDLEDDYPSL